VKVDPIFGHPRLAAIYDALDPDRSDLDAYLEMVRDFEPIMFLILAVVQVLWLFSWRRAECM